ncbi:MAG: peptide-methionine (S)-S-oxide reductase MsrA [Anaerolineae bacterium]|nr:peptide-methionine (S)-S-oxide reductase MsrA [Anaerolineae bacterium]
MSQTSSTETIVLAGGCFWCLEAVYDQVRGVTDVVSGYAGGTVVSPSYELVCTGSTGHAEVVRVTFDPSVISYREILEIFFDTHDPTTLNRQGADTGTQYRSAIFTQNEQQKAEAQAVIRELTEAGAYSSSIVTEVTALTEYYPAEEYHQEYFENNLSRPYCRAVVGPKVAKFQKDFADRLKFVL